MSLDDSRARPRRIAPGRDGGRHRHRLEVVITCSIPKTRRAWNWCQAQTPAPARAQAVAAAGCGGQWPPRPRPRAAPHQRPRAYAGTRKQSPREATEFPIAPVGPLWAIVRHGADQHSRATDPGQCQLLAKEERPLGEPPR